MSCQAAAGGSAWAMTLATPGALGSTASNSTAWSRTCSEEGSEEDVQKLEGGRERGLADGRMGGREGDSTTVKTIIISISILAME